MSGYNGCCYPAIANRDRTCEVSEDCVLKGKEKKKVKTKERKKERKKEKKRKGRKGRRIEGHVTIFFSFCHCVVQ